MNHTIHQRNLSLEISHINFGDNELWLEKTDHNLFNEIGASRSWTLKDGVGHDPNGGNGPVSG